MVKDSCLRRNIFGLIFSTLLITIFPIINDSNKVDAALNDDSKKLFDLFSPKGNYVIQIGIMRSKYNAEKWADKFIKKGYPTYLAKVENPSPTFYGIYYRVRIGAFKKFSYAKWFGENVLRSEGIEYWIDNKANDHLSFGVQQYSPKNQFSSVMNSSENANYLVAQDGISLESDTIGDMTTSQSIAYKKGPESDSAATNYQASLFEISVPTTSDTQNVIYSTIKTDGISFQTETSSQFTTGSATEDIIFDNVDMKFEDDGFESDKKRLSNGFIKNNFVDPVRLTLRHETSYKVEKPYSVVNNRTSVRFEYSKLLLRSLFLQLDMLLTTYWKQDHRAEAENKKVYLSSGIRQAFLQGSLGRTSLKAGYQILIWGESDGGAITDEISPRNNSELLFINLEESRISQLMLTVDQFTSFGDWGFFFIPDPEFNQKPTKGTAYYYDPLGVEYKDEPKGKGIQDAAKYFEYGLRWKKTFGQSDISMMAANLIDNNYSYQMDINSGFINKRKMCYYLTGLTFNMPVWKFLFRGEIAYKMGKAYNNILFDIIKKDAIDASLVLDYSNNRNFSLSLESVNNYIIDKKKEIAGIPQYEHTLILVVSDRYFHEKLSVNWMISYNEPYMSLFNALMVTYQWNDHLLFEIDGYYPFVDDKNSNLWQFRAHKQVAGKIQIQF